MQQQHTGKTPRHKLKTSSSSPNLLQNSTATSSSPNLLQQVAAASSAYRYQQYYGGSAANGSSTYTSRSSTWDRISNNSSNMSRWSRGMKRLSAPFQQWPWSSHSVHLHSSMPIGDPSHTYTTYENGSAATTATFGRLKITNNPSSSQHQLKQQQPSMDDGDDDDDEKAQNGDGVVMFTIEAYSIPLSNKQQQQTSLSGSSSDTAYGTPHVVALRFVKIQGSSKVFKLATGWIGGVLSSVTPETPSDDSVGMV